jgi:hypothetical protein
LVSKLALALGALAVGSVTLLAVTARTRPPPPPPVTPPPPPAPPIVTPPRPPVEIQQPPPTPPVIQPKPPVEIQPPPPAPPPELVLPPPYPEVPTQEALKKWEEEIREYARQEWEKVEQALKTYGGYAVIFKVEPPPERLAMFESMLLNININSRGMCVYGGGYRWYDYLQAWVYDVKATWSPSEDMKAECKRRIRAAIESAFSGYYTEVREY